MYKKVIALSSLSLLFCIWVCNPIDVVYEGRSDRGCISQLRRTKEFGDYPLDCWFDTKFALTTSLAEARGNTFSEVWQQGLRILSQFKSL